MVILSFARNRFTFVSPDLMMGHESI
jgi:hypothetical protein